MTHPYPQLKSDDQLNMDFQDMQQLKKRLKDMRYQKTSKVPTFSKQEAISQKMNILKQK